MRAELSAPMHQWRPVDLQSQFILKTSGIEKFALVFEN